MSDGSGPRTAAASISTGSERLLTVEVDNPTPEEVRVLRSSVNCHRVIVTQRLATFVFPADQEEAFQAARRRYANTPVVPEPTVYFDFNSPFAYAATRFADEVESECGATFDWRGFQLFPPWRVFFDVSGAPAQTRWQRNKVFLSEIGLPAHEDRPPLRDTHNALMAFEFAKLSGAARAYRDRVFAAHWVEQRDISEVAVLRDLALEIGIDGIALAETISGGSLAHLLALHRNEAIRSGVFGVPTYVLGDSLFWGRDCRQELRAELKGPRRAMDGSTNSRENAAVDA